MVESNPTKIPVLMIDDDELIAEALTEFLHKYDFELQSCVHPQNGLEILEKDRHKLLLLDVMLPDLNGYEVCRLIRQTSDIPIIMLTACSDLNDKVRGFEFGADDYLAKPFEPLELIARMRRLIERHEQKVSTIEPATDSRRFIIDKEKRKVVIDDIDIELTAIEFDILYLLSCEPDVVYDRLTILRYVKGLNDNVMLQTRAIDNSISRLRRKLNVPGTDHEFIRTVWGQGYSFIGVD